MCVFLWILIINIDSVLQIVDFEEAKNLDKNKNISVFSVLGNNKVLIKYSGNIYANIKSLYKENKINSIEKEQKILSKTQIKELNLLKTRSVPSAVHIAAAISSYARILINEYKNIPGNPCVMSDTDSAVLTKPLPNHLVGNELGQMKLEHEIKRGIFIRKKLYYILTKDNQEIIKASGIDSSKLNYNLFLKLLNGEPIQIERVKFNVAWKNLTVKVEKSNITVRGLTDNVKTLHNLKVFNTKPEKEDIFILFSNLEIIIFFIFLLLFIIFIIFYILFFK